MPTATPSELVAARDYEALFVPAIFQPWAERIIVSADLRAGDHVIDVACGTGVAARAALDKVGASGRVVGLDLAPGMIEAAAEVEPRVDWRVGSADDIPFPKNSFDAALCQFGLMFFPDSGQALGELARIVKPGGKLSIAVWNTIDDNAVYKDIAALLDKEVGEAAAEATRRPFRLGDAAEVVNMLSKAGFEAIHVQTGAEQARFPSPRKLVEVEIRGWLPLFGITLDEQRIEEILIIADEKLAYIAGQDGTARFQTSAHIITAVAA